MASVHIANFVDMNFMFNIDAGVGKGRANRRLDVMLVQYLLRIAVNVERSDSGTSQSRITPPEYKGQLLATDGICGKITLRYIEHYQAFRNTHTTHSGTNDMQFKMKVKADGAIDPWRYPLRMDFYNKNSGVAVEPTSTLACLCYDAAKSQDFVFSTFESMPVELKSRLLSR